MALVVGVSGVKCAAGEGKMCTGSGQGSGLLVAWGVGFWGSSPASFPLPSSLIKGRISSFLLYGPKTTLPKTLFILKMILHCLCGAFIAKPPLQNYQKLQTQTLLQGESRKKTKK